VKLKSDTCPVCHKKYYDYDSHGCFHRGPAKTIIGYHGTRPIYGRANPLFSTPKKKGAN
jgi:hypothetical protein